MSATIISTHSLLRQTESHPTLRRRVPLCRHHGFRARNERKPTVRYAVISRIRTAPPNLHFFVIAPEHAFKAARVEQAPLRWIAGLPQPPRCVALQLPAIN